MPPTAAGATSAITTAGGSGDPRLGFVHRESPSVVLLLVEPLDRRLGLGLGIHLDETKALAAARVTVGDHLVLCTVPYWENHSSRLEWVTA